MSDRQERPFSAASRLESAKPLNSTSPVNRLLARSQSQSPADARRYQSSISRTQALHDSAKHHSSPSKSRSFRQQVSRQSPLPQSSSKSYSCVKLLAAVVLMSWQVLIVLILAFTLRTTRQINARIVQQGEGSYQAVDKIKHALTALLQTAVYTVCGSLLSCIELFCMDWQFELYHA